MLPEEALYFLSKANSTYLLAGRDRMKRGQEIRSAAEAASGDPRGGSFTLVAIATDASPQAHTRIAIDDSLLMSPDEPGVVLFTSGTTGRPKGVILPRKCFLPTKAAPPGSSSICYRASNWMGGCYKLLESVLGGAEVYAIGERAGAREILDVLDAHVITEAMLTPTLLRHMRETLVGGPDGQPPASERARVSASFGAMDALKCSASKLDETTKRFWCDLTGLSFENPWGSTELGQLATTGVSEKEVRRRPEPGTRRDSHLCIRGEQGLHWRRVSRRRIEAVRGRLR